MCKDEDRSLGSKQSGPEDVSASRSEPKRQGPWTPRPLHPSRPVLVHLPTWPSSAANLNYLFHPCINFFPAMFIFTHSTLVIFSSISLFFFCFLKLFCLFGWYESCEKMVCVYIYILPASLIVANFSVPKRDMEKKKKEFTNLGGPTTPSMMTCATCTPNGWNSLARHCDKALKANLAQPVSLYYYSKQPRLKLQTRIPHDLRAGWWVKFQNTYTVRSNRQCRLQKLSSHWTEWSLFLSQPCPAGPSIYI